MRKLKLYIKLFRIVILLVVISAVCLFYLPDNISNFQVGLSSTALGIGISIAAVEAIKKLNEYKRIKKTAGLLKIITVPYLNNQVINFKENSKLYKDMYVFEHALAFMLIAQNYDKVSATFDKNWFQLVFSSDFIDAINSDNQINTIGHAISEVLIFNKTLTWHALNAERLLSRDRTKFIKEDYEHFILQARKIRDDIDDCVEKLEKYTDELSKELDNIFANTGVIYEEIKR